MRESDSSTMLGLVLLLGLAEILVVVLLVTGCWLL